MSKILLCFLLGLLAHATHSQTFTFSDTHPINNVDSLENWLKTHPQPTPERLKNLIQLERTYSWGYYDSQGKKLKEIEQLNAQFKTPVAQAATLFGKALYEGHSNPALAAQSAMAALEKFKALKDTSGMVHVYCLLVNNATRNTAGGAKSSSGLVEGYLQNAQQLVKNSTDPHTQLSVKLMTAVSLYAPAFKQNKSGNKVEELKNHLSETFRFMEEAQKGLCRRHWLNLCLFAFANLPCDGPTFANLPLYHFWHAL